jgi:2-dehydro-3-deoxygluconokinase
MTRGIASVGECMIELSGADAGLWRMGFAGDSLNTLWALRALTDAAPADYVSAFGDDPFSRDQMAFFAANGIGIASSPVIPGARPGLYAITLAGAERSFTYWRSDAAARRLADDPGALEKSLDNRALVYFSGISLAILEPHARAALLAALGRARRRGSLIAFDPNYRPRLWTNAETARATVIEALQLTDIALPTFPDEQALFGDRDPEATAVRIQTLGAGEIVVKNGEAPAFVLGNGGKGSVPATHVPSPVDTTGAGDSFNGAYLSARLLGIPPVAATKRAHRVAGAVVQVRGALAPFDLLKIAFDR